MGAVSAGGLHVFQLNSPSQPQPGGFSMSSTGSTRARHHLLGPPAIGSCICLTLSSIVELRGYVGP